MPVHLFFCDFGHFLPGSVAAAVWRALAPKTRDGVPKLGNTTAFHRNCSTTAQAAAKSAQSRRPEIQTKSNCPSFSCPPNGSGHLMTFMMLLMVFGDSMDNLTQPRVWQPHLQHLKRGFALKESWVVLLSLQRSGTHWFLVQISRKRCTSSCPIFKSLKMQHDSRKLNLCLKIKLLVQSHVPVHQVLNLYH